MTGDNRRGFTLIELLVALALSTIMLTAVIGLVGRMSSHTDQITKQKAEIWKHVFKLRLQQDLMNGTSYSLSGNSLTIDGYSERAYPSQTTTLRKNEVRYTVTKVGKKLILLRDDVGQHQRVRNLVCDDVESMIIRDSQGREFKNRSGGLDLDLTVLFLDESENVVLSVTHLR